MAGLRALVCLSFSGAVALTFVLLACALPGYNNWWPLFTLLFYVLTPFPYVIAKRYVSDSTVHSPCMEAAVFITSGLVLSAFGLPIILARNPHESPVLSWGAAWLVTSGNLVMFLTLLAYFVVFNRDDEFSAASSIW